MEFNFMQLSNLNETLKGMQDKTLPFKVSLIIAKDLAAIAKEIEFFIEQERNFAQKFLVTNEDGTFVTEGDGVFRIKDGLEEECRKAREELDNFTCNIDIRKIPISAVENLDLTPKQVGALELILEEE